MDFAQAIGILISKRGAALTENNRRLISLLNTDYKLMTKAIMKRIQPIMPLITDESQMPLITGVSNIQHIQVSLAILRDAIQAYSQKQVPNFILFSTDFQKAFPSVNLKYILNILKIMNFPPAII